MKWVLNFAIFSALTALSGCASTGVDGEQLPANPLANGYALISLCGPNDRERAGGGFDFECGKGRTLRQIDGDGGLRLIKRDQVYVLPGKHAVTVAGARGYQMNYSLDVVAGKIYDVGAQAHVAVYSNDPALVRHYEQDMKVKYRSGYYKE